MNKQIEFSKYQGTGNDFIMIDNRNLIVSLTQEQIARYCDRRFGIGADGLILLQNALDADFEMVYFNSDGKMSSMCGNGGRCIVQFAHQLHIFNQKTYFNAIDGKHEGIVDNQIIHLKMNSVSQIKIDGSNFVLNTGSPHYVIFETNIDAINIIDEGRKIRYSANYPEGINVNFVEIIGPQKIKVRTYERGVEDETYSCGTGVVAASLCFQLLTQHQQTQTDVLTKGGSLQVTFKKDLNAYDDIYLKGSAEKVFEGSIYL